MLHGAAETPHGSAVCPFAPSVLCRPEFAVRHAVWSSSEVTIRMDYSAQDLGPLFAPRSIAIVGVPRKDYRFGGLSYLMRLEECGFPGRLYPINPKASEIRGRPCYPDLDSLPEVPDLAIVCIPAAGVPRLLEDCGRIGVRYIHILSSGFGETGTDEGRRLENEVSRLADRYGLLVVGPNCMGPYCPEAGLTAWGAIPGLPGPLGIISQSGGITQRLTEYACSLGLGTARAVSFGNGTVLSAPDYLQYMASEERVNAVAMYLEGVADARRFLAAAREACLQKPVILWKGGESEAGSRTAASHTGSLAGNKSTWKAFTRQTGVIRVRTLDEWLDAALAFCFLPRGMGRRVFLVGGGGGNSVANADTCIREGLQMAALSEQTLGWLEENVPVVGSIPGNPLDAWRTFLDAEYLQGLLEAAFSDPAVDLVMVDRLIPRKAYHMPHMPDPTPALIRFLSDRSASKPVIFTVDSEGGDPELAAAGAELRALFGRAGIAAYPSVERAARALARRDRYYRWRAGVGG